MTYIWDYIWEFYFNLNNKINKNISRLIHKIKYITYEYECAQYKMLYYYKIRYQGNNIIHYKVNILFGFEDIKPNLKLFKDNI